MKGLTNYINANVAINEGQQHVYFITFEGDYEQTSALVVAESEEAAKELMMNDVRTEVRTMNDVHITDLSKELKPTVSNKILATDYFA